MSKTIKKLLDSRSWIAHIDDERNLGNSIIVTLRDGWNFIDEKTVALKALIRLANCNMELIGSL